MMREGQSPASDKRLRIVFHGRLRVGEGTIGPPDRAPCKRQNYRRVGRQRIGLEGLPSLRQAFLQPANSTLQKELVPAPRLDVLGIQRQRVEKLALSFAEIAFPHK